MKNVASSGGGGEKRKERAYDQKPLTFNNLENESFFNTTSTIVGGILKNFFNLFAHND